MQKINDKRWSDCECRVRQGFERMGGYRQREREREKILIIFSRVVLGSGSDL